MAGFQDWELNIISFQDRIITSSQDRAKDESSKTRQAFNRENAFFLKTVWNKRLNIIFAVVIDVNYHKVCDHLACDKQVGIQCSFLTTLRDTVSDNSCSCQNLKFMNTNGSYHWAVLAEGWIGSSIQTILNHLQPPDIFQSGFFNTLRTKAVCVSCYIFFMWLDARMCLCDSLCERKGWTLAIFAWGVIK